MHAIIRNAADRSDEEEIIREILESEGAASSSISERLRAVKKQVKVR
jgi:hypothetical protein